MAVYDRNADAATAVAAFLAQFQIASTGAITYVSGSHTFHVWWLHRALQKIAWDYSISGDDGINLSKPNPSTSEALGTIITLLNHTTNFSVNYTITDQVATYLFGGSVSQNDGADLYSGLQVLGKVNSATALQIVQNNALLTSHWGAGKNQTDSSTLLRILVKTRSSGAYIDNQVVNVKATEWGDTYAIWQTTLGLGEKVAAINTFSDPQNNSVLATVQAYSITKSEGYKLINVDGAGNKPFIGEWSYGAYNKKALYEFVKSILTRGTSQTLYGIDADLWTGRLYSCVITTPRSGTWVQNESVSWSGGTGQLVAVNTTAGGSTARLVLHLNTGVAPAAAATITGNGGAIGTVSGTPTALTTAPNHLGQFTGTAWIGSYGIGFAASELGSSDSVTDLDGNLLSPLNSIIASVAVTTGATGDDPHVFLAVKHDTLNRPKYDQYAAAAGNTSGAGTFTISGAIAADTPTNGSVMVLNTGGGGTTYEQLPYTSWSGSTFTLTGTLPRTYSLNDPVFVPILYESAVGGGTLKLAQASMVYSADRQLIGWVRHGNPATPDKPVPISGTLTSAGISLTVVLDDES